MKLFKSISILTLALFILTSCGSNLGSVVSNMTELKSAIDKAQPGDVIVMSNGIWKDAEIDFKAKGLVDKPIVLKAETPGQVFIEGQSFLKIAGHYLEVHDLYFRNGYTPINSVIQFKSDKENAAYDCKVVNCVIENFTQLDRRKKDHWVEFWGQRNQLLSCYIAGKSNNGPTVRAELEGNQHANCHHVIAHNYFGPRPRRGGPRGETMQLGDSYTSMVPAFIEVRDNFLDRCNGEVEVISSKSNYNQFINNVFYKCEGSLVLRHGNYATIDSNWFIGDDNSDNIGGVRVINTGHWITNNYFYNLKGNEFRSAIAVMNGIPKSPLNRYNQVTDVVIAHNSWVDCISPLQFSVGSNVNKSDVLPKSEIRSALPIRTTVANNIIYNSKTVSKAIVKYYDTPGDIDFKYNYVSGVEGVENIDGFINTEMNVSNGQSNVPFVQLADSNAKLFDGFDFSTINNDIFSNSRSANQAGAICAVKDAKYKVIDVDKYGPSWFVVSKGNANAKRVTVKSSEDLYASFEKANNGDTIIIDADILKLNKTIQVNKSVVLASSKKEQQVSLQFTSEENVPAFELGPGVDINLKHLIVEGSKTLTCFEPNHADMSIAANVFVDDCTLSGFNSIYRSKKGSFTDTVKVVNSVMKNLVNGFILHSETDDKGDYNAEFLILENNQVSDVENVFVDFYRGGYDESTIGGNFVFNNNTVERAGKSGSDEILLKTQGIVNVQVLNNTFSSVQSGFIARLWGEKNNVESGNTIQGKSKIVTDEFLTQKLLY
ncbi:chondroitinase-B domain-containing protein [Labilibaculum antarcticum]|uniref:Alginate lyase n=1 Tax=Labilibaculum antarcticum TaxID=1717717 RepID=A0A1Y1CMH1_9BACT|nr:chondroitinase-B domain-containing protein [Labilibaculum antarcticum]BAX81606.1 alginate lyase [Labilibaculum antarcticum]